MGKYLPYANECIQKFKPAVEENAGIRLEDVVAKEAAEHPDFHTDYEFADYAAMFVDREYPGIIFVNEKKYDQLEDSLSEITLGITHELAHLAHAKLIQTEIARNILKKENGQCTLSSMQDAINYFNKYWKSQSFREGFAESISLKGLFNLYDRHTRNEALEQMISLASYKKFPKRLRPYEKGYKFYSKVMRVLQAGILEIARSPPINEIEVRIPLLYLLRRCPAKTIKTMPRLIAEDIKNKYQKAYYKFKCARNLVHL